MTYGIGDDPDNLNYFRDVGGFLETVPAPKGSFKEGSEARPLASGGVRWVGYTQAMWHWDFFRKEWYDLLRSLCPDSSGIIYIETTTNDNEDEFAVYEARYIWPIELEKDSHRRMDFDVHFNRLVLET